MNAIAKYVRQAQKRAAAQNRTLFQADVAKSLGVSAPLLNQWMKERRHPSLGQALKLERKTGGVIRVEDLVGPVRGSKRNTD